MEKMHMQAARDQGYIIDECCNPPIAYKGPRFQPTAIRECFTPLETRLLALTDRHQELSDFVVKVASDSDSTYAQEAKDLLSRIRMQMAEAQRSARE